MDARLRQGVHWTALHLKWQHHPPRIGGAAAAGAARFVGELRTRILCELPRKCMSSALNKNIPRFDHENINTKYSITIMAEQQEETTAAAVPPDTPKSETGELEKHGMAVTSLFRT